MSSQPSVRSTAVEILNSLFDNYSDYEKKVFSLAEKRHFTGRDKKFLYKLVNGVIIYQVLLDFIIDMAYNRSINRLEKAALNLLRVGAYQKFILNTPDHAFIYETVEAARKIGKRKLTGLVNGVLRNLPDEEQWRKSLAGLATNKQLAIQYSHPEWLVERWSKNFGRENTRKLLKFNNNYTKIFFRHNALKIDWLELKSSLEQDYRDLEYYELNNINLFSLPETARVINSNVIKEGRAMVQDYSQLFSPILMEPQPGDKILDACAAPGGKTGLIAQLSANRAEITAADIAEERLQTLRENLRVSGADIEKIIKADAAVSEFEKYDKILLDVPCSGTGVIARRADLRWNRIASDIREYNDEQLQMLYNMAKYVVKGGIIIYSTCSLEPEENWGVLENFLNIKDFKVEDARKFVDEKYCDDRGAVNIKPFKHELTGSFAVRLKKIS